MSDKPKRKCAYCCESHWSLVQSVQFRVWLCSNCLAELQNMNAGYDLLGETSPAMNKPPETYKGKGIKYAEERVRLKAGKTGTK